MQHAIFVELKLPAERYWSQQNAIKYLIVDIVSNHHTPSTVQYMHQIEILFNQNLTKKNIGESSCRDLV